MTNRKCPDYQGILILQVSLYDKAIIKCVDCAGVFIFKCPAILYNRMVFYTSRNDKCPYKKTK